MRVLVTGASGAIGSRLVGQLVAQGHEVIGTCVRPASAALLESLHVRPVLLDLLDAAAVRQSVLEAKPDAIIHEATALANGQFTRKLDRTFALTNRLRTQGTDNLLAAARQAGVARFVGQSFAPYRYQRTGGWVKAEDDPIDPHPPAPALQTNLAMNHLDDVVTAAGGIALRYGGFYGAANDGLVPAVSKRRMPVVGDGGGLMSFVHLHDAAVATALALEHEGPAIYNIVDDDPAPMREWLPALASALGAPPPRHVPVWLARLIAGSSLPMMTEARGAANGKAKRELGWTLRYPSWREGFRAAYSQV